MLEKKIILMLWLQDPQLCDLLISSTLNYNSLKLVLN